MSRCSHQSVAGGVVVLMSIFRFVRQVGSAWDAITILRPASSKRPRTSNHFYAKPRSPGPAHYQRQSYVIFFIKKHQYIYIYIYMCRVLTQECIYIYTHTTITVRAHACVFTVRTNLLKKKHRNVSTQSKYMVYTCYNGDILQLKQPQLISGNATWPAFHLRISIVSFCRLINCRQLSCAYNQQLCCCSSASSGAALVEGGGEDRMKVAIVFDERKKG